MRTEMASKELLQSWVDDGLIVIVLEGRGLQDWGRKFYLGVEKVGDLKVGQLLMPWEWVMGRKVEIIEILNQVPEEMAVV